MVANVTPSDTWAALQADPEARLVDVRTDAEWTFVGVPDLSDANQETVLLPWQIYPSMQTNAAFVPQLAKAGVEPHHHVYFICRSGARSMAAALASQAAGYEHVFNVAGGFEGNPDAHGHRGTVEGWKAEGLPWRQR